MLFHVPFFAELFSAEFALERLESSVYSVNVCLKALGLSKILPTFTALVEFEFLMNLLDVLLEFICPSILCPTLTALVGLEFLVNCLVVSLQVF